MGSISLQPGIFKKLTLTHGSEALNNSVHVIEVAGFFSKAQSSSKFRDIHA